MKEYDTIMDSIMESYGEDLVYKMEVGEALSGSKIWAYAFFSSLYPTKSRKSDLTYRETILLTAVHHARELTTISQVVLQMLTILYRYEAGDVFTLALLEKAAVITIPIVNIDGVNLIDKIYQQSGELEAVRKNQR